MNRRRLLNLILAGMTLPVGLPAFAARQQLKGARAWQDAEKLRLVFDLTGPVRYKTFTLVAPDRIILDLADTQAPAVLNHLALQGSPVRAVRSAHYGAQDTRVVLELAHPVEVESFILGPGEGAANRLVLDLKRAGAPVVAARKPADARAATGGQARQGPGHGSRHHGGGRCRSRRQGPGCAERPGRSGKGHRPDRGAESGTPHQPAEGLQGQAGAQ